MNLPILQSDLSRMRFVWRTLLAGGVLWMALVQIPASLAQQTTGSNARAQPADVASIDAVIHAAFDVMSGPAGKERDWTRFRSLFKPSAQFIVAPRRQDGAGINFRVSTLDEYIAQSRQWLANNALYEREVHRITEQYGHMAHAFSTYESREEPGASKVTARGVSSFQLVYDGERWWIVNWFWLGERANTPIPKKYLP